MKDTDLRRALRAIQSSLDLLVAAIPTPVPSRKAPATDALILRMLDTCDLDRLSGLRDRALLSLGFAAQLRRSELVAVNAEDLELTKAGYRVLIRPCVQRKQPRQILIPHGSRLRPVAALQDWLQESGIAAGPVITRVNKADRLQGRLDGGSVPAIVKRHAEAAGLDPAMFSGHSLCIGLRHSTASVL